MPNRKLSRWGTDERNGPDEQSGDCLLSTDQVPCDQITDKEEKGRNTPPPTSSPEEGDARQNTDNKALSTRDYKG